jgi:hypothetical protein
MALIVLNRAKMGTETTTDAFIQAQEVMMRIAQYSHPVRTIQAVCNHCHK